MTTIFYVAIAVALSAFLSMGLNAFALLQIIKINDTLRYQTLGFNTTRGEIERAADALSHLSGFDPELKAVLDESSRLIEATQKSLKDSARLQEEAADLLSLFHAEVDMGTLHQAESDGVDQDLNEFIGNTLALDDNAGSAQALKQILEEMSPITSDAQTPFDDLFPDAQNLGAVQTRVDRMNEFVDTSFAQTSQRVAQSADVQAIGDAVQDVTDFWNHEEQPNHA